MNIIMTIKLQCWQPSKNSRLKAHWFLGKYSCCKQYVLELQRYWQRSCFYGTYFLEASSKATIITMSPSISVSSINSSVKLSEKSKHKIHIHLFSPYIICSKMNVLSLAGYSACIHTIYEENVTLMAAICVFAQAVHWVKHEHFKTGVPPSWVGFWPLKSARDHKWYTIIWEEGSIK